MSSDAILQTSSLRHRFGGLIALAGVDLTVRRDHITALIGPNGAGKTTLFNAISGTIVPTSGTVEFQGIDVTGRRPDQLSALGLTRTFQLARGLSELTVLENLALYAHRQPGESACRAVLGGVSVRRREKEVVAQAWHILDQLNLAMVANHRAAELSGGQKKLLELGRALMGEPRLLLLDEPMAGVNPALAEEIARQLLAIKRSGITLLIVEHNMSFIRRISDLVVVMAAGKVVAEGSFDDVRSNELVQSAYFGNTA